MSNAMEAYDKCIFEGYTPDQVRIESDETLRKILNPILHSRDYFIEDSSHNGSEQSVYKLLNIGDSDLTVERFDNGKTVVYFSCDKVFRAVAGKVEKIVSERLRTDWTLC